MKFLKRFGRFISEEKTTEDVVITRKKIKKVKQTIPLKTATAEEVAEKFISLIKQSGDDIKKYIEKQ